MATLFYVVWPCVCEWTKPKISTEDAWCGWSLVSWSCPLRSNTQSAQKWGSSSCMTHSMAKRKTSIRISIISNGSRFHLRVTGPFDTVPEATIGLHHGANPSLGCFPPPSAMTAWAMVKVSSVEDKVKQDEVRRWRHADVGFIGAQGPFQDCLPKNSSFPRAWASGPF